MTVRRPSHRQPMLGVPSAPPLPEDLEALLRRLRMPHTRRLAPEVIATAKAQRWEPVEVLRALFTEEVAGRDRSALATRRAAAAFPTGKTFEVVGLQGQFDPGADAAGAAHAGVGAPAGELGGLRAVGHRQDILARSPGPASC